MNAAAEWRRRAAKPAAEARGIQFNPPMSKRMDPTFDRKDRGHANIAAMVKAIDE